MMLHFGIFSSKRAVCGGVNKNVIFVKENTFDKELEFECYCRRNRRVRIIIHTNMNVGSRIFLFRNSLWVVHLLVLVSSLNKTAWWSPVCWLTGRPLRSNQQNFQKNVQKVSCQISLLQPIVSLMRFLKMAYHMTLGVFCNFVTVGHLSADL